VGLEGPELGTQGREELRVGRGIAGNADPQETPLLSVWKVECSSSGQMRRKGEGQLVCEA